jgi:hypothetical protein
MNRQRRRPNDIERPVPPGPLRPVWSMDPNLSTEGVAILLMTSSDIVDEWRQVRLGT